MFKYSHIIIWLHLIGLKNSSCIRYLSDIQVPSNRIDWVWNRKKMRNYAEGTALTKIQATCKKEEGLIHLHYRSRHSLVTLYLYLIFSYQTIWYSEMFPLLQIDAPKIKISVLGWGMNAPIIAAIPIIGAKKWTIPTMQRLSKVHLYVNMTSIVT